MAHYHIKLKCANLVKSTINLTNSISSSVKLSLLLLCKVNLNDLLNTLLTENYRYAEADILLTILTLEKN